MHVPALQKAAARLEQTWFNPLLKKEGGFTDGLVSEKQITDAENRLLRFAGYLAEAFPETAETGGIIESPLRETPAMKAALEQTFRTCIPGRLFLKMDSHLPAAGSIKARGGFHEVLKHAEELALSHGMVRITDDYREFASEPFRQFFSKYTIQAGSTGNLGLSIGIMSAKLGFRVVIHMSADAKQWKKDLLRERGCTVIEYDTDYCAAVANGRKLSDENPYSYFVDDENSVDLFTGYAVAGRRLQKQLAEMQLPVDREHPLFVYLPCGIGGAPGGIAYELKRIFGNAVHCFFEEPVNACCMLAGMASGLHDAISVYDIGLDGKTLADGLAVGRPSAFAGRAVEERLSGISTVRDDRLLPLKNLLLETEQIYIEPSSCAAYGTLIRRADMAEYIRRQNLDSFMEQAVHIVWATGGSLVPLSLR